MKVLLVTGVYPPRIGGPSRQTQQLAQALIQRGIDTRVVTFGEEPMETLQAGIPVTFLDGRRRGWGDKLTKNWQVYRDLCGIMRAFQPTVVHQQTAVANLALYTGLAARRCGIPSLLKYSSDLIWERLNRSSGQGASLSQGLARFKLTRQQRLLFSLYDCLWVTTPAFQERLHQDFQVPAAKIYLQPNFIDLSPFTQVAAARSAPVHPGRLILTVARLQPWKGIDTCIQALALLKDLPVTLRIVGAGRPAYIAELRQQVEALDLLTRVTFLEQVPPADIQQQYAQADLFVLASSYEPFGIVLVEAMAAGVPIVAARVGGIPAVVDGSARLVPPKDAKALATALRTLLEHPDQAAQLVQQGQVRAAAFGLGQGCDRMVEQYQRLSAAPGGQQSPRTAP